MRRDELREAMAFLVIGPAALFAFSWLLALVAVLIGVVWILWR